MKQLPVGVVSSEFRVREALEKVIDTIIMVEQLQQICWDGYSNEYREYSLISRTEKHGIDLGNVDDMITVYHQWKKDLTDKSFKVFLEYEQFDFSENVMYPIGEAKEVGLLLKIKK